MVLTKWDGPILTNNFYKPFWQTVGNHVKTPTKWNTIDALGAILCNFQISIASFGNLDTLAYFDILDKISLFTTLIVNCDILCACAQWGSWGYYLSNDNIRSRYKSQPIIICGGYKGKQSKFYHANKPLESTVCLPKGSHEFVKSGVWALKITNNQSQTCKLGGFI